MIENYYPIDFREIKDKNRISISKDVIEKLCNPEEVLFVKYKANGEEVIVIQNASDPPISDNIIGRSKIDARERITLSMKVQKEIGFMGHEAKKFVGIIELGIDGGVKILELCRIGRISNKVKYNG